jgi:hypothetical protein
MRLKEINGISQKVVGTDGPSAQSPNSYREMSTTSDDPARKMAAGFGDETLNHSQAHCCEFPHEF